MPKDEFLSYIRDFMKKISLPEEAAEYLMGVEEMIFGDPGLLEFFLKLKNDFMVEYELGLNECFEALKTKAEACGVSEYVFNFIFLINCTDMLLEKYKDADIPEGIFWDNCWKMPKSPGMNNCLSARIRVLPLCLLNWVRMYI